MILKNKFTIIIYILFVISLCLRLYKLGSLPESLTWDEAALSYNSFSLLETGADEYGHKMPLILRSFDDYKPAFYSYLSIPFINYFGVTIFAIRALSALSGASLVISLYLIGFFLTKDRRVGLLAAMLSITTPILLLYSRIALEANLALAIFLFGFALLLNNSKTINFLIGNLLLILSAFTYHTPRYIVPIIFITSLVTFGKIISNKTKLLSILIFVILYIPIIYFLVTPKLNSRFTETSVFTKKSILVGTIVKTQDINSISSFISSNYFYILDFSGRYLSNFNPYVLFIKSSGHELYHVDGLGLFNSFEIGFWILGLFVLVKRIIKINPIFTLILIVAPIPAALTVDWFSPLRALLLWPFYLVLSAIGTLYFIDKMKINFKYILLSLLFVGWSFSSLRTIETVFYYQPYVHSGAYQYGFAQVVPFVSERLIEKKYDNVIIDSPHAQPHIFFLVFSKYTPQIYQEEIKWRVNDYSPRTNFNFGPYKFRNIFWQDDKKLKNTLFVGDIESLPYDQVSNTKDAKIIKEFTSPDGNISFRVVENL